MRDRKRNRKRVRPSATIRQGMASPRLAKPQEPIAIIGVGCRFPGASGAHEFWHMLCEGTDAITQFPEGRFDIQAAIGAPGTPGTMANGFGGFLEQVDLFDAHFFGVSPKEANRMDPQQRLLLEVAWEAMEDAASMPSESRNSDTGVFIGMCLNDYEDLMFAEREGLDLYTITGGGRFSAAGRIAFCLGLEGPAVLVDTACSSSTVAAHLACQSLRSGECEMALAGGVNLILQPQVNICLSQSGVLAADGRCKFGDAGADGYVRSEGAAIVVLKRLRDAQRDRDPIRAVLLGSAVNHTGGNESALFTPSSSRIRAVMRSAHEAAGIDPAEVQYIEAHGTGTPVGDRVELPALGIERRGKHPDAGSCFVGSVKTNIGHCEAASGAASLIKVALALEHGQIPPSLHFRKPNPRIPFEKLGLQIPTTLAPWPSAPRALAAINSFGLCGTNAHVVMEAPPHIPTSDAHVDEWQLLLISAHTLKSLEGATDRLAMHLESKGDLNLADVAYTLQVGRADFENRRMLVCRNSADAIDALHTRDPERIRDTSRVTAGERVAFLFPGLGDQYVGMAAGLYEADAVYRQVMDECCEILKPLLKQDLRDVILPGWRGGVVGDPKQNQTGKTPLDFRRMVGKKSADDLGELGQTRVAQPAIFAVEYALARMWMAWGVEPVAMIGYSIGEYVAACLSGVFSLDDALRLMVTRAHLIQDLPAGAMLSIAMPYEELQSRIGTEINVSGIHGPRSCVASGAEDNIKELQKRLAEEGVACRRVHTTHAFHSRMMLPAVDDFKVELATVATSPPQIPFISTVTGTWVTSAQVMDPEYWTQHLCGTVRFSEGVAELWQQSDITLLELGPGQTLTSLALQHPMHEGAECHSAMPTLRHVFQAQDDREFILTTLGRLWLRGVTIDWRAVFAGADRRRIHLPTYVFDRKRHWLDASDRDGERAVADTAAGIPERSSAVGSVMPANQTQSAAGRNDIDDWFYTPSWKQRPLIANTGNTCNAGGGRAGWIVFLDAGGVGETMTARLRADGERVVTVAHGMRRHRKDRESYEIRATEADDYRWLFSELSDEALAPSHIAHLWCVEDFSDSPGNVKRSVHLGLNSILYIVQAVAALKLAGVLHFGVIHTGVWDITGRETLDALKATLIGPCRVVPQEYPEILFKSVDFVLEDDEGAEHMIAQAIGELRDWDTEAVVAYRGHHRWVQGLERAVLPSPNPSATLRERGLYVITGGSGRVGQVVAEFLAKACHARLVLIDRSRFPPEAEWERICRSEPKTSRLRWRIDAMKRIRETATQVILRQADVGNPSELSAVIDQVRERFGRIDGVVHAAGVPDSGLIQLKDVSSGASILNPKVNGTFAVYEALRCEPPDFLVLFSSTASFSGGIGQVNYCAASVFMDAFAHQVGRTGEFPVMSINWFAWEWADWEHDVAGDVPQIVDHLREVRERYGIKQQNGCNAFARALSCGLSQLVVSPIDADRLLREEFLMDGNPSGTESIDPPLGAGSVRPDLGIPFVAPQNELEEFVARLWEDALGIRGIGTHDDYFELGGHSLAGLRIVARLKERYHINLQLQELLAEPTIEDLALRVEEALLAQIEALDDSGPADGHTTEEQAR